LDQAAQRAQQFENQAKKSLNAAQPESKGLLGQAIGQAKQVVDTLKSGLNTITNVPVLKQIKDAAGFLNSRYDAFLQSRYGAAAPFIKYSGQAVDFGLMAMGKLVPGASILGSAPAMMLGELNNLRRWAAGNPIVMKVMAQGIQGIYNGLLGLRNL